MLPSFHTTGRVYGEGRCSEVASPFRDSELIILPALLCFRLLVKAS